MHVYINVLFIFLVSDNNASLREKQGWLKYNPGQAQMVRLKMKETHEHRMAWIHGTEQPSITDILEAYPRYTDRDGYIYG